MCTENLFREQMHRVSVLRTYIWMGPQSHTTAESCSVRRPLDCAHLAWCERGTKHSSMSWIPHIKAVKTHLPQFHDHSATLTIFLALVLRPLPQFPWFQMIILPFSWLYLKHPRILRSPRLTCRRWYLKYLGLGRIKTVFYQDHIFSTN